MRTAADESSNRVDTPRNYWAATDAIEPIHDYNIPIPPFKHPPTREDFPQIRRRNKAPEQKKEQPHSPPADEGHVDEFA